MGHWPRFRVFEFRVFQRVETRFTSHGSDSCVGHIDRVVN